jgi:hypothetical protein
MEMETRGWIEGMIEVEVYMQLVHSRPGLEDKENHA